MAVLMSVRGSVAKKFLVLGHLWRGENCQLRQVSLKARSPNLRLQFANTSEQHC